jgi:hypothetical protein
MGKDAMYKDHEKNGDPLQVTSTAYFASKIFN